MKKGTKKYSKLQKDVMIIILESSLKMENAKLDSIINWEYRPDSLPIIITKAAIFEIERQLKNLKKIS